MPRIRDQKKYAARRSEILAITAELFAKQGFHQTGIAEICEALDVSPGTLYRYFPSKDALILGLVEADAQEGHLLLDKLTTAKDFCAGLSDILTQAIQTVSNPNYGKLALEIEAEGMRNEAVNKVLREHDEALRNQLACAIDDASRENRIKPELPSNVLADFLMQCVDGALAKSISGTKFNDQRRAIKCIVDALLQPSSI